MAAGGKPGPALRRACGDGTPRPGMVRQALSRPFTLPPLRRLEPRLALGAFRLPILVRAEPVSSGDRSGLDGGLCRHGFRHPRLRGFRATRRRRKTSSNVHSADSEATSGPLGPLPRDCGHLADGRDARDHAQHREHSLPSGFFRSRPTWPPSSSALRPKNGMCAISTSSSRVFVPPFSCSRNGRRTFRWKSVFTAPFFSRRVC